MKESLLYPLIKKYLEALGYTVYAEVAFKGTNRQIDVVGLKEDSQESIAIELKSSYSLGVKIQSQFNSNYFDKSYVAVPKPKKETSVQINPFIGLIYVDIDNQAIEVVFHPQKPKFGYTYDQLLSRLFLNEINKTMTAGVAITKEGATAYQISMDNVISFLKTHGPSDLNTIVKNVNLHWSNPKSSLRMAFDRFETNRIGKDTSCRPIKYYLL